MSKEIEKLEKWDYNNKDLASYDILSGNSLEYNPHRRTNE